MRKLAFQFPSMLSSCPGTKSGQKAFCRESALRSMLLRVLLYGSMPSIVPPCLSYRVLCCKICEPQAGSIFLSAGQEEKGMPAYFTDDNSDGGIIRLPAVRCVPVALPRERTGVLSIYWLLFRPAWTAWRRLVRGRCLLFRRRPDIRVLYT